MSAQRENMAPDLNPLGDATPMVIVEDTEANTKLSRKTTTTTNSTKSHHPILLLLNGFPGVGKLTVAKELQASLLADNIPTNLVDNHSIIDFVIKTVERRTPAYYAKRKAVLRSEFPNKYTDTTNMVVIMTAGFANEVEVDVDQWKDHVAVARERGFHFIHVNLGCDIEANIKRITSEERVKGREGPNARLKNIE